MAQYSRLIRFALGGVVAACVVGAAALWLIRRHIWLPVPKAMVRVEGRSDSDAFEFAEGDLRMVANARPGSVFVQFDVPASQLARGGKEGRGIVWGPNSPRGVLAASRGMPVSGMPPASERRED